jgi:GcrA cell cycle regulator
MDQTSWPPEHSSALRRHIAAGLPFSAIAKAINLEFKTAYTRSGVIGRAARMGLGGSDRPQPSLQAGPPCPERVVRPLPVEPGSAVLRRLTAILKSQEPPKLRCAEVEPRHLSLVELECGDCHYPYGGDEEGEVITFCGHPRQPGSSYCTPHFLLSRNPVTSPEREAIDIALWLRIAETA